MTTVFHLFSSSFASLWWAFVLTVVLLGVYLWVCLNCKPARRLDVLDVFGAVVLFFFLMFQSALLFGARAVKDITDPLETAVTVAVNVLPEDSVLSTEKTQEVIEKVEREYPMAAAFVNLNRFKGVKVGEIARLAITELNSGINWYMVRRVAWIAGGFAVILAASLYLGGGTAGGRGDRRRRSGEYGSTAVSGAARERRPGGRRAPRRGRH